GCGARGWGWWCCWAAAGADGRRFLPPRPRVGGEGWGVRLRPTPSPPTPLPRSGGEGRKTGRRQPTGEVAMNLRTTLVLAVLAAAGVGVWWIGPKLPEWLSPVLPPPPRSDAGTPEVFGQERTPKTTKRIEIY